PRAARAGSPARASRYRQAPPHPSRTVPLSRERSQSHQWGDASSHRRAAAWPQCQPTRNHEEIIMATGTPEAGPIARRARTSASGQAPRRLGLVLAVIATAQLMVVLDLTIVIVALPHIQQDLGFSGTNLEWVVNAYAVAFGGLLLLGGRAGGPLGGRPVFIPGLNGF